MTRKEVDTNFMCNCKYHEFPYMRHTNYEYTKSVLFLAVENNNVEIVRSLLSNSNININYVSSYESEQFIHRNGAFPWYDRYQKTPLFQAVENENFEIVKLLKSNENVDVNCLCHFEYYKDREYPIKINRTPLSMAVAKNNIEITNLLLSNEKIDVNIM